MHDLKFLNQYYASYDEEGRLLTRHGHVEFITTMHFIHRYLQNGMRVLEIGAGTGRYSHALAREGYEVDAVELVEHNLRQFRAATQEGERITVRQGNACDLHFLPDGAYDVTLLLGPMYHLFAPEDKAAALREAVRVTRAGGVIYVAYCMADASITTLAFRKGQALSLVERGMLEPDTFRTHSHAEDLFELYTMQDIDALRSVLPVTRLHYVAADGYANHMREELAAMDDATYDLYLRYHLATCERIELTGYSHHTLDIFRKNEAGGIS